MTVVNNLSRLGLFDSKVPRYTSYPTANHFGTRITGEEFSSWLEEIPRGDSISLYAHVPFCRRLCWFCACRTQGVRRGNPVQSYLEFLHREIGMVGDRLQPGITLSHLHWGGGTPTILAPAQMTALVAEITNRFQFAEGAEFSVEIDPGEVDEARLDALAAAGMNRASIGIQDFDPEIQKVIGREQSYELTRDVIAELRKRNIRSLNTDLLYGLPFQDLARITETTQKLISLKPDRIALYGYAHVPWMARRQRLIPEKQLPDSVQRLELFNAARALLVEAGYNAIGIDHFALPGDGLSTAQRDGKLRRNFQGYTDDTSETLVGLGASSISRFPQGFAQNISATSGYVSAIREGKLAAARGHAFTAEDKLRGRVIEELMCTFAVDIGAIESEFSEVPIDLRPELARAQQDFAPFVTFTADRLDIRSDGYPLARMIARQFDAFAVDQSGHSLAI